MPGICIVMISTFLVFWVGAIGGPIDVSMIAALLKNRLYTTEYFEITPF